MDSQTPRPSPENQQILLVKLREMQDGGGGRLVTLIIS
jgi:hypothetical protein